MDSYLVCGFLNLLDLSETLVGIVLDELLDFLEGFPQHVSVTLGADGTL